jgi:autoinducer 2 (AI-2) kinase
VAADRILVIDAGTSSLRALSVSVAGDVTPAGAVAWQTETPADAAPFGRELDGATVSEALSSLVASAAAHGPYAAAALTGQREGIVFVDERGDAICVSPNIDARASAEGMVIDAARAADVYAATGHLPSLMQAPAKLAWLRMHRAGDAERVGGVIPLADWLATRLAPHTAMSASLAVENGVRDVRTGAPPEYLVELGFATSLLPRVVPDGTIVAEPDVGPLRGVPVVLTGADTQCALVGMGAIRAGDCAVAAGWSAPVQFVTDAPIFDAGMRTWTGLHVAPSRYVLESNASETGRAWAWVCALASVAPDEADALATRAQPAAGDVLSVLSARAMNAARMNAGLGALLLPLPFVMSSPSKADVLRSALEATAYAVRANLDQLEQIGGEAIPLLRLGAGMSRSRTFVQVLASVLDRPVEVARDPETTALGAAALASVAVALHPDLDAAVASMCGGRRTVEPDARASAVYDDAYARWCAAADALERMAAEG